MTKPRRRVDPRPRVLSVAQTADYIGRSLSWFSEHREELEARGFPRPLPVVDGYDRVAIDACLDRLGGELDAPDDFDVAWERASNG